MLNQKKIKIDDYNYNLPGEKIAFVPKTERDTSKLLVYNMNDKTITDSTFEQLNDFLNPDMMLIFNNSRVIHARLLVHNTTGAAIEIFCLEPILPTSELTHALAVTKQTTWKCLVGNAKRWKSPLTISLIINDKPVTITAIKGERLDDAFEVQFCWDDEQVTFAEWVEVYGKMPLPPYIKRAAEKSDEIRYQTVYAKVDGSVAAPTAGLHFSDKLLSKIKQNGIKTDYVTLHVGAGTFKPVTAEEIGEHFMHSEQIVIDRNMIQRLVNQLDKKIIAVGTTVARSLESLFIIGAKLYLQLPQPFHINQWEYYENSNIQQVTTSVALNALIDFMKDNDLEFITASTQLMIVPSYQHRLIKGIITNFHQPKSTLLLLIASILGDDWKNIYAHALSHDYRFLSYGDANFYYM